MLNSSDVDEQSGGVELATAGDALGREAWRIGGRRKIVIAALAGAMQMLSGAPEIVLFTWAILGVLWLGQVWRKKISFWPALRRFAVVVVLVAGLSAIQLLPFFDLLKHSERDSAYTRADAYPMPVWGWANFVVPVFHCFEIFLEPRFSLIRRGLPPIIWAWELWRWRWWRFGGCGNSRSAFWLWRIGRDRCWRWAITV